MKEDKKSGIENNPQVIHDELWDHYSGLPNPMWYQHIKELEDEEENTSDSDDTEVTTE
jgi:hypothetical protein